jgi:hypothetical protein
MPQRGINQIGSFRRLAFVRIWVISSFWELPPARRV